MTSYATAADVAEGFRKLTESETAICSALLEEAGLIIDSCNSSASDDAKKVVSCRMVRRVFAASDASAPMGATQGSMSALGYSQSWTLTNGSNGELYISKLEKKLLGCGKIGCVSPIERLV